MASVFSGHLVNGLTHRLRLVILRQNRCLLESETNRQTGCPHNRLTVAASRTELPLPDGVEGGCVQDTMAAAVSDFDGTHVSFGTDGHAQNDNAFKPAIDGFHWVLWARILQ